MTTSDKTEAKDPDQLRAEIAEIRADLGDTVEALAAKADVKAQAQAKVEQTKQQVRDKVETTKVQLDSLKAKAAERTEVSRVKAQASTERGKQALSRYAPWPQVAAGAAATVVALVIGGRTLQARRATPVRRRFGR
ncbi:DUF3618 domain-containing protein [Cryptosporangium sp. NPDC048952]|uniref:DUF3618 domain-containing protein n=1 Tax=Cryptosporangium sp. NPDC048952 TaxID=3363961 RepID=UPI0037231A81